MLLLSALATAAGCQPSTSGKLQGKWLGRPDTQAARSAREAKKYGDGATRKSSAADQNADGLSEHGGIVDSLGQTDWEQYDVEVEFNFLSETRLEMSLANGSQTRAGRWKILKTVPTGCRIEVEIDQEPPTGESEPAKPSELRRYELEMDEMEGRCVGFLLSEIGADSQLGLLYFQRPEK